jgi:hypothetical protein
MTRATSKLSVRFDFAPQRAAPARERRGLSLGQKPGLFSNILLHRRYSAAPPFAMITPINALLGRTGTLGASQIAEAEYEGSLVDCHTGAAHGRKRLGDHEQCLQERPPYMVRSNIQHPAPRENRARLAARTGTAVHWCPKVPIWRSVSTKQNLDCERPIRAGGLLPCGRLCQKRRAHLLKSSQFVLLFASHHPTT